MCFSHYQQNLQIFHFAYLFAKLQSRCPVLTDFFYKKFLNSAFLPDCQTITCLYLTFEVSMLKNGYISMADLHYIHKTLYLCIGKEIEKFHTARRHCRTHSGAWRSQCRPVDGRVRDRRFYTASKPPQTAPASQRYSFFRFFQFWKSAKINSPREIGQPTSQVGTFGCGRDAFAGFGLGAWRCLRTGQADAPSHPFFFPRQGGPFTPPPTYSISIAYLHIFLAVINRYY